MCQKRKLIVINKKLTLFKGSNSLDRIRRGLFLKVTHINE